jgi:hypothetical protein
LAGGGGQLLLQVEQLRDGDVDVLLLGLGGLKLSDGVALRRNVLLQLE